MHKAQRKLRIHGRGSVDNAIVLGLLERQEVEKKDKTDKRASRVRVKVVADRQRETVHPEVRATIAPGSPVYIDEAPGYTGLTDYVHEAVDHAEEYVRGVVYVNSMENFWSLLKRTLGAIYVSVEAEHLGRYPDEQACRFNQRKQNDQERFFLAGGRIGGRRLTYRR